MPSDLQHTPGTFALDPERSTIRFDTHHVFNLGKVHGFFSVLSGEVHLARAPEDSSVTAVVDAASFSSGSGQRDRVVRSRKYLHTDEHPHMTFTSTAVRADGAGYAVDGELTVRGVTRPVTLAVTPELLESSEVRFRATTRVDRFDFGITAQKGMTGRHLDLTLQAVAVRAPAAA